VAQRSRRIIQASIFTLLIGIILGLIGWINQATIEDEWHWWTVMRPYAAAEVWPYVLSAAKEKALKPGDSFKECVSDCPQMVVVPARSFTMGGETKSEGEPQHLVTFAKPFAIAKYELTFAEWDACVAGGGCNGYNPRDEGWGRGDQPVINVNWDDAKAYVTWLSRVTGKVYLLLSEAEYEYAARAGATTAYPWGDDVKLNGQVMANCSDCGSEWDGRQPAPVGSFQPNQFGLYDMVGNVMEWTADCGHTNYDGAPADGSAWLANHGGECGSHVIRGGSWYFYRGYFRGRAIGLRQTFNARDVNVGFRVARTLIAP